MESIVYFSDRTDLFLMPCLYIFHDGS